MATSGGSRFDDQEYINWLRTTLALMHMKEDLEGFTDNQATIFHNGLLASFGQATRFCHCTSTDIKKNGRNQRWYMTCPDCDLWLQKVISNHRNAHFPKLSPANTDPQLWRVDPWETIKIYLPYGCVKDRSARDMDIQGMLSLFINCKHFSSGKHIGRQDLLQELLLIRNSMFHSGDFKVNDADTQNYLKTILDFLQGMTGLTKSEAASLQTATDRVTQLKTNVIELAVYKEQELRALGQAQIALERDVRDVRSRVDGIQKEHDSQGTELKIHGDALKELQAAQKRFDEFLQQNDIVDDMAHLQKRVADIDHRLHSVEKKIRLQPNSDTHPCGVNDFQNTCEVLQQQLLRMYRKDIYWENPLTSEEAHLSEMYVHLSVKRIREINEHGEMKDVNEQSLQPSKLIYKDIFQSKTGHLCKNVYISGDAGVGKSTFCNQLVLDWCRAVQTSPDDTLTTEDRELLSTFRFLFHISLRDSGNTYHVEDMIQEQLFNDRQSFSISDILNAESCLIILDGLDEWSCPAIAKKCPKINKDIPGRNAAFENCTFLTTTRSWKYDVMSLKNKDVDKHIELDGIGKEQAKELAQKMITYLDRDSIANNNVDEFLKDVHDNKLNAFLTVPVLLIQLITLWCFGKDFGNSQLQLHCSMLDLLFERSEKNLSEEFSKCSTTNVTIQKMLPECFSTKHCCQKYADLLHCLAKMAYKALFNKLKEESLVFKKSTMEIFGISSSDIKRCLKCGILSQCRDYGNRTGKYKKFSFLHKKVQECLAALYLVTNDKAEDTLEEVKQLCISGETMLEMNQVWLFVAGMDRDLTRQLLEHLGHVVSADERVNTHRQTVDNDYDSLIGDIQRCVCDCVLEGMNNGHHYENVCFQDFYILGRIVRDVERLLLCSDMSKAKSVYIDTDDIDAASLASITGQLLNCCSLHRLSLNDYRSSLIPMTPATSLIPDRTVAALVDNNCDSLTAMSLLTGITATNKLVTAICRNISKHLMALELNKVTVTHGHKEQILHSLSQSPTIRQLDLRELHCTDHGYKCKATIDWSAMIQLHELTLSSMYVDNMESLPHCVEKVELSDVTLPVTSLRDFARGLSQTKRKVTVELILVTFIETREECGDLKGFLQNCPDLMLTRWWYDDWKNTWSIEFHTRGQ